MLPSHNRLRHDKDIKALFGKAGSVFDRVCGLKYKKNNLEQSRFASVVGTKVSKRAVDRNRVKRQIRAMIEENLHKITSGYDVAILVGPSAMAKSREEIEKSLLKSFKKAKLL